MSRFKTGDIVSLRSGGPNLCVAQVLFPKENSDAPLAYQCQWFHDGEAREYCFLEPMLKLVDAAPPQLLAVN